MPNSRQRCNLAAVTGGKYGIAPANPGIVGSDERGRRTAGLGAAARRIATNFNELVVSLGKPGPQLKRVETRDIPGPHGATAAEPGVVDIVVTDVADFHDEI